MPSPTLSDYLELWGLEKNFLLFEDASLGFGLRLSPKDISCLANDEINLFANKTAQFLNGLPSGIDIQFVQDIKSCGDKILNDHENLAPDATNEIANSLCRDRTLRLKSLDTKGFIPRHELLCFVRRPMTQALMSKPRLLSKSEKFANISESRLNTELQHIETLRDDLKTGFESLGIETTHLDSKKIVEKMYLQWNPGRNQPLGTFDPEDIRASLLFSDVGLHEKGFAISNVQHRVISLKLLPEQTHAGLAMALQDLPFDSRLFVSIQVPDQIREIESLQTSRRLAYSMARGKKTGVSDLESEAKLQDLETLLEQMISQGEKVFRLSLNVVVSSTSEADLDEKVSKTLFTIRNMAAAEGMEESFAAFTIFNQLAIPNARSKERAKRVKTSNLADLLPLFGPWEGMNKPRVLLRSRSGSLFKFDPFDSNLTNANQLISGGSGSGKSFLTNVLLLQMLKENPKVFFVDIGGSYKKLCENLGGEYLNLGVGLGLSINPFDLLPGETTVSNQKIKFLLGLIELMTKEDTEARLPRLERTEIEEAILKVYDSKPNPRLSDLREILLNHADPGIKRYGKILGSWCGNTPFGSFLDRPTSIALSKQIIAFDLKGLESYPDLQTVCLFLITDLIWREVQKDRQTMKFLVFDECWKLLKNDSGLVFIEEAFRTFRKYNASAIAISQDIDDFAKSKISSAILPNCSIKWLLMQPQSDAKRLCEVLNLNPNEIELVKSLVQKKGVYSETFLVAQERRSVCVIETSPLEYWIATTDPRDLAALDRDQLENPSKSHHARLLDLARKYPQGVANSEREEKK